MATPGFVIKQTIAKDQVKFAKDASRFLSMAKVRGSNDTPFTLNFAGEICSAGIQANEFGTGKAKKTSYSIGIEIEEDSSEYRTFQMIAALAKIEAEKISPNMEYSDLIKDDNKIYIKLKTDSQNRSFTTKTNLSINPKKYSESNDYDILSYSGEAQIWFNLEDLKYGISLTPKKLEFIKNDE